jgi:caffeoyl-CoA O-methyltransferase
MATTAADATPTLPKDQTSTNGAASGAEQVTRHSEVGHKSLLQSDALYQVLLNS